jgi:hypothetical protein
MTESRAFGPERARRPHLSKLTTEVGDLRRDVERAFTRSEAKDGYPDLQWVDGGAPAALGGDMIVKGAGMLQGQSFAELDIDSTYGLIITAMKPGLAGNDFTVEIVSGAATDVTLTGNALVLTFNDGTDDDDAVATAINAAAADTDGILRAVSSGTQNAAAWTAAGAMAATALSGGLGEGFECFVSGVECLPANNGTTSSVAVVAEDEITVTVPDLTAETDARAAGDLAALVVNSDGVVSNTMTAVLA